MDRVRNGKWQPKRLSERTLDLYPRTIYPEHYTFKGGIDAPTENLVVTIYDSTATAFAGFIFSGCNDTVSTLRHG